MTPLTALYKFVGPARLNVLLDKDIRFTQPATLNDPFEFRCGAPEDPGHFEAKIHKKIEDESLRDSRNFGVLSLTEKEDSIPIWTHYADSHKGFAIGFDTSSEWLENARGEGKLRRVEYVKKRILSTRPSKEHPELRSGDILMTKRDEWEYEAEWRWIERRGPSEYAKVKSTDDGELIFLCPFPPASVREIILGYRSSPALIESIRTLASTSDYAHVSLLRMALDESRYRLNVERL